MLSFQHTSPSSCHLKPTPFIYIGFITLRISSISYSQPTYLPTNQLTELETHPPRQLSLAQQQQPPLVSVTVSAKKKDKANLAFSDILAQLNNNNKRTSYPSLLLTFRTFDYGWPDIAPPLTRGDNYRTHDPILLLIKPSQSQIVSPRARTSRRLYPFFFFFCLSHHLSLLITFQNGS